MFARFRNLFAFCSHKSSGSLASREEGYIILEKIFSSSDVAHLKALLEKEEVKVRLRNVEAILQYRFNNKALLLVALIHHSYSHDLGISVDYERFEFLGDTVLESVISTYIFKKFFQFKEGELSELRAYIVSGTSLYSLSKNLKISENIFLGKAEVAEKNIHNIVADSFEAILGAIYLDSSFYKVEEIILRIFSIYIDDTVLNNSFHDPKTMLQQLCQQRYKRLPNYKVIKVEGPDHDKTFFIELTITQIIEGGEKETVFTVQASGKSKRIAEKLAAEEAIRQIN